LTIGIFGMILLGSAAATVAQQTVHERGLQDDEIGICHATGSSSNPFVFMVVERDGPDHREHEQHEHDRMDVQSEEECNEGAMAPQAQAPASSNEDPVSCHDEHQNGLSPCDADLSVEKQGAVVGEHIVFDVLVKSLGPAEAAGAKLVDRLPDVGRAWNLTGADASLCWMVEREVRCDFGDLEAGAERSIRMKALQCPHDCGDDVVNTVIVHARNDRNPANDRAQVVVPIEECPEEDWSWADAEAPPPTSTPTPPVQETPVAANETDPGNHTAPQNGTASEDAKPDVGVRQRVDQDHLGVKIVLQATSLGKDTATNVTLLDELPELGRPWALSGHDAAECALEGRVVTCAFGDLEPGAFRTIELTAFTDRMPCGDHLVNAATVTADLDTYPRNNRSTSSIKARSC
jgi:hypothetical protein